MNATPDGLVGHNRQPIPHEPLRVVRGHSAVRALAPLVAEIAAQSGQGQDGVDLAYFLSITKGPKKTPCLLLSRGAAYPPNEPSVEGYRGAVFLYEYRYAGLGTRVFAASDSIGRRNVFAPPAARAALAATAARTLVERGAHLVHLTYLADGKSNETNGYLDETDGDGELGNDSGGSFYSAAAVAAIEFSLKRSLGRGDRRLWTLLEGIVPLYLPLETNFERTIERLGKKTRTNLRYYRRLAQREQGCTFVPEVQISLAEFITFNRKCDYAHTVSDLLAERRWRALSNVAHPVLCGVRDGYGRWVCLMGGRRNGGEMELDWQMNHKDFARYSLSTAARAWLIDHEVGRGSTRFSIEGSSLHSMMRSFVHGRVTTLTVKRDSLYTRLLARLAPRILPKDNQVGRIISDTSLPWRAW